MSNGVSGVIGNVNGNGKCQRMSNCCELWNCKTLQITRFVIAILAIAAAYICFQYGINAAITLPLAGLGLILLILQARFEGNSKEIRTPMHSPNSSIALASPPLNQKGVEQIVPAAPVAAVRAPLAQPLPQHLSPVHIPSPSDPSNPNLRHRPSLPSIPSGSSSHTPSPEGGTPQADKVEKPPSQERLSPKSQRAIIASEITTAIQEKDTEKLTRFLSMVGIKECGATFILDGLNNNLLHIAATFAAKGDRKAREMLDFLRQYDRNGEAWEAENRQGLTPRQIMLLSDVSATHRHHRKTESTFC